MKAFLAEAKLDEYAEALCSAGYDGMLALVCITDADLESLNVKMGHRRKLLARIAKHKKDIEKNQEELRKASSSVRMASVSTSQDAKAIKAALQDGASVAELKQVGVP